MCGMTVDAEDVRRVIAAGMPGYRVDSVTELGRGLDNRAFEINGELVVRFRTSPADAPPTASVRLEAAVLEAVARFVSLPVPRPVLVDEKAGCIGYFKLPGEPLITLDHVPPTSRDAVASTLGHFLEVLHRRAPPELYQLGTLDAEPLPAWRAEAADGFARVREHVPVDHRARMEAFLGEDPPEGEWAPVFSHNALGIEHVLLDPVRLSVTGIIDWSDAAIVDPAVDFGRILRDLGPTGLDQALARYRYDGEPGSFASRARFYARCGAIEDLAFGIDHGSKRHVHKSLAALDWLFPR